MKAIPKPPRRGTKSAKKWKIYYEARASWYADHAINLAKDYPKAAQLAQKDAEHYAEGARQLRDRTHPAVLLGVWK